MKSVVYFNSFGKGFYRIWEKRVLSFRSYTRSPPSKALPTLSSRVAFFVDSLGENQGEAERAIFFSRSSPAAKPASGVAPSAARAAFERPCDPNMGRSAECSLPTLPPERFLVPPLPPSFLWALSGVKKQRPPSLFAFERTARLLPSLTPLLLRFWIKNRRLGSDGRC